MTAERQDNKTVYLCRMIIRFKEYQITYGRAKDIEAKIKELIETELRTTVDPKLEYKEK